MLQFPFDYITDIDKQNESNNESLLVGMMYLHSALETLSEQITELIARVREIG